MKQRRQIAVSHPVLNGNEKTYVMECLDSTWISSIGRFIGLFEESVASFCGVRHAVACSSGTTALHLALLACGIGPGDEVIVPAVTYVAAANAVRYCGARPVFVDVEKDTGNLDPGLIEPAITERTRAILVVHLYGHPADMDPILQLARRLKLHVIEDGAEALGAEYFGRRVGSMGDVAIFSFFGNKTVTTGEGGMVVTSSETIAEKARLLRGQGMDPQRRYWFPVVGYNYRMTNIEAAIGLAQMEGVEARLEERRRLAGWYRQYLGRLSEVVDLPVERAEVRHSYWLYTIHLRETANLSRDELAVALSQAGIETRPVFYPMHWLPPYKEPAGRYPVAESFSIRGLSLPTHSLVSEEDVAYIADQIEAFCLRGAGRAGKQKPRQ
jgi:perosamine synthetase